MEIKLSPEVAKLVQDHLGTGRYPSADALILHALSVLDRAEATSEERLAVLQAEVRAGLEALQQKALRDGDDFFHQFLSPGETRSPFEDRGRRYRITDPAASDAAQIWESLATPRQNAAVRYLSTLRDLLRRIASLPELGSVRDEIDPTVRAVAVRTHVVFYTTDLKGVVVLRIVEARKASPEESREVDFLPETE